MIQRLVYEFGEGHGAVRQHLISITSSRAWTCTALQARQLVQERLQWFNDLCISISSAKGMGQCDNVQSALQAQELVQHYKLKSFIQHYKINSLYIITSSRVCTALQAQQLVRERLQWFNDLCMSAAKGMGQCDSSISIVAESSNGDNGVVKMLLIASDFIDLTITKV